MDIKKNIGSRITSSRKTIGITIKELAERTGSLSAARIGNWEQGTRSPGPVEAIVLAKVLGVAASYLLCLSDDPRGDLTLQKDVLPRQIPLLPLSESNISKSKLQKITKNIRSHLNETPSIYLNPKNNLNAGPNVFATHIEDKSMSPHFTSTDILIADTDRKPKPGNYVIAHDKINNTNIIRKYKETTTSKKNHFELVALNSDWGTIEIKNAKDGNIIAIIIEHRRFYK